jgi:endonuclease/exonuclease/phosphatase family metal-dependent hydrolase
MWLRSAASAALLAGVAACATARNFDEGLTPVIVGHRVMRQEAGPALRIVTFNIKFGEHMDRAGDLLSSPGPLKNADLLFIQESDRDGIERLSRDLSMNYVYVPSAIHPSTNREMGVALLSPWPLDDAGDVPLPHHHRVTKMRRTAVAATVATPAGDVRVYGVHLETWFGASDAARRDQARTLLTDAEPWTGPVVIAGDFNGTGGADEIARAGFRWLTRDVHNTAWVFDLDHILVRGLCAVGNPAAARGPSAHGISDHRPVWAVVEPCQG